MSENATTIAFGHRLDVLDISLLLSSQKVPHWAEPMPTGSWRIQVDSEQALEALALIRLHWQENRDWNLIHQAPLLGWTTAPLFVLMGPLLITWLTWQQGRVAESAGIADSGRIMAGQWWRTITAQTMHADLGHLGSNMVSGYFLLNLLGGRVRLGPSAVALTLCAAMANLSTAALLTNHRSLGFSTFTFAALGAMAAVELRHFPHTKALSWYWRMQPLLAAIFIAVFTGIGSPEEPVDILGHAFGFVWGVLAFLFVPLQHGYRKQRGNLQDAPWLLAYYGILGYSWWLAVG